MAYNYQDDTGWIASGPSIRGSVVMQEEVKKLAPEGAYPYLHNFLQSGESANPQQLAGECSRLAKKTKDKDVKDSLTRLARAAAIAKGSIVCTH